MKIAKLLFFFILPIFIYAIEYDVKFLGLKDQKILNVVKNSTSLMKLKERPPKTVNSLKYRANSDISNMISILKNYGYYDANIKIDFEEKNNVLSVIIFISTGPRYLIKKIDFINCETNQEIDEIKLHPKMIGLKIDDPIIARNIINAQKKLNYVFSNQGYPLHKVIKRDVVIDQSEKTAYITWIVNLGSYSKFGATTITGLKDIKPSVIKKNIGYKEGEKYQISKVEETQKQLLGTNLFSLVDIDHSKEVDEKNELLMNIKLYEALHKYFSAGVSYATIEGFGVSFNWANKNFRNVGDLLSLDIDFAQRTFLGVLNFKKTDYLRKGQDYVLRLEAQREKIPSVYLAFNYFMLTRLDRKVNDNLSFSTGFKTEYIDVTNSANPGHFFLLGVPTYLKYSSANDLLNPTKGFTLIYFPKPYYNAINDRSFFLKQKVLSELYIPIDKNKKLVFAFRIQVGSIIGPNVFKLPMTKLFLGGSDDDLRGYKYHSVSPLVNNRPIGGRSAMFFTFEPRLRMSSSIGLVPFFDMGKVCLGRFPNFKNPWFKSLGVGFRYFSFFGPLRLDIGFPLNRRKGIDDVYKIYASIGQTF
ncbi:MAG: Translocation and assembly module TamA [Candidatus Anoxychlamydiales bacterium]|nr:Translocation and assembly module TamA [Candidatus Anoxychlamydiales bacterium]